MVSHKFIWFYSLVIVNSAPGSWPKYEIICIFSTTEGRLYILLTSVEKRTNTP